MSVSIPEDNFHHRAIQWLAHRQVVIMLLVGYITTFSTLILSSSNLLVSLPIIFIIVMNTYSSVRHDRSMMCIKCMQNMPCNGGEQAQKKIKSLIVFHFFSQSLMRAIFIEIAALVLYSILNRAHIYFGNNSNSYITIGNIIFWTYIYIVEKINWTHHQLRPWCPYCKDWGWGDSIIEPDPSPTLEKTTS